MARKLRIEYPGAVYHVMSRGDRQEMIFRDDADREVFLVTLGDACAKTNWQIHAYCLMENHFHLVVETPQGSLVVGMKWFLGTYTGRFNRRHQLCGRVFSGRYRSLVVDADSPGYLQTVCEFVHLNPARANVLRQEEPLRTYRWSSYPAYLDRPNRRPPWVRVDRVFGEMGILKDNTPGRERFERLMEDRRRAELPQQYGQIRRGWCFGDEAFRKDLLARVEAQRGTSHYGEELQESDAEKAERLVGDELQKLGWKENELTVRRKGDRAKLRLALKLRAETGMTLKWIAARLHMGTGSGLSNLLSKPKRR